MCAGSQKILPFKRGRMQISGLKTPSELKLGHIDLDSQNDTYSYQYIPILSGPLNCLILTVLSEF